ncbi:MAG: hypothetical protein EXS16_05020 [Gemmataceae bacterium]|nr:hypothetical protein [Gemmataceae bacterium]
MPTQPRRLRSGRIFDWVVIPVSTFVFLGLVLYHYRRLDEQHADTKLAKELASETLVDAPIPKISNVWPGWRGPNRDGVSTETNILTTWPTDGPKELWRQPVGVGYSSFAVADGRVITTFQDGDFEAVVAYDADSGKERWRFRHPAQYRNSFGDGPRATPTIAGDFVYSLGGTGVLHCLKAKANADFVERVWSLDFAQVFNARMPKWGVGHTPLIDGDRIYIMPGGADGNAFAALDKKTGAILWKKHDDEPSYASPIAGVFAGEKQILFFAGARLVAVAPDTGEELWDHPRVVDSNCNIATPIVVGDYVFISAGYNRGCAVLKIEKAGDTWKPALVYAHRRMRNHFSTSVRRGDFLYGFDDTNLTCMNFRTGEILWKERGFDKGSVLLVANQLIIYGENGILALADATPKEYTEKSRFTFTKNGRSCWSVPVLANGKLYVRDHERLVCFDVAAKK